MSVSDNVLGLLEKNKGGYMSGEDIAKNLGVTRNSVWKAIKKLQSAGYNIDAVTNRGYCLASDNHVLSSQSIEKYIDDKNIVIEYYKSLTSTNTVLKERAENGAVEGLVIVTSEQTAGRGRMGRTFYSPMETGVYFSVLLKPDMMPEDSLLITTCAAVAVAKAIEKNTSLEPKIKWVNDVYCQEKKVCGILTEASMDFECGKIQYAVLGIGINIYKPENDFPDEIKSIASALYADKNDSPDAVSMITADTVNYFMENYHYLTEKKFLKDYRKMSMIKDTEVDVIRSGERRKAFAMDIDDKFRLHVRYDDGSEEYLNSGEVSVRKV